MKLLLDQNISRRLVKQLSHTFPGIEHVSLVGLHECSDHEIWEFANKNDFTIVTCDADFHDISVLRGHPPKIIWLRLGNKRTAVIAGILAGMSEAVSEFVTSPSMAALAVLEIGDGPT